MNKILSSRYKNVFSLEEDIFTNHELTTKRKYVYNDKAYSTLSASVIENNERNNSTKYRFNFNVTNLHTNVLFNITGQDSYDTVLEKRNFISDDDAFEFSLNEILKNNFGKYYYITPNSDTSCTNNYLRPYPDDLSLLSNNGYNNYNIFLSYAHKKENNFELNGIPLVDGLAIYSYQQITYAGRQMTKAFVNIPHNLNSSDVIKINNNSTYTIYAIGDENQDNQSNIFIIDEVLNLSNSYFTKLTNNTESQYFVRKFKKLNVKIDLFKTSFSESLYSDQVFSLSCEDFDIKGIKDCFDRDLNEIYLSFIKKRATSYSPTLFSNVISGFENLVANSKYDINTINIQDSSSYLSLINSNQDEYNGDIIEYNPIDQTITTLIDVQHVFNTVNRNSNNYLEGYYYKPFHKIKIKSFSDFIEVYDTNPPASAYKIHNTRFIDRPLLSNSASDLHPFVNDFHNVFENIYLYIRRQDACYQYLLNSNQPIIKGDCKDFVDKEYKIKNNEC